MLLLCLCLVININAQILDKKVTVNYKNSTIEEVLKDLNKRYNVNFSYSNNSIPLKKKVTVQLSNKSIQTVLKEVFKDTDVIYEPLGSQVVLKKSVKKKPVESNQKLKSNSVVSDTLIQNISPTRNPVEEIEEVYVSKDTVVFFVEPQYKELQVLDTIDKMSLKKQYLLEKRRLKRQYYQKIDSIEGSSNKKSKEDLKSQFKNVSVKLRDKIESIKDSLDTFKFYVKDTIGVSDTTNINKTDDKAIDTSEYIYRRAQVTFVSPLGTNGVEGSKVVNNFSFNVLQGYSAGLNGFEFGGLFNIEKKFVKGFQFAGLGNVVNGPVKGAQFCGLMNINNGYTQGGQFSGLINVVGDSAFAMQASGFINVVGNDCEGAQFAGFMNIANGNMYGMQGAGFLNFTRKEVGGGQSAGFMNVAGGNVYGPQIAGFMNVAPDTLRGIQIAGFLNVAEKVKGSQIGFINVADTVTGAQIGFFSFAKRGYRRLEFWGSEGLYGNVAFKTGTSRFYNIFAGGVRPEGSAITWGFGYGFGSEIKLSKKLLLNLDLMAFNIHEDEIDYNELNILGQFKPTFGVLLGRKASIFAGPVLNVMVSDHFNVESNTYGSPITPDWDFFNSTYSNNVNVSMWIGWNAGIRF
jgi:hypothetical protein